jgi:type VI secretion system secreted protein Hcp
MAILIKYGDLKGESKIEGFTDHFEVGSFQVGVGRGIGSARGTSTREASIASVSEIVVTKQTDGISIDSPRASRARSTRK